MTLYELLVMIDSTFFPLRQISKDEIDCCPNTVFKLELCFMCEDESHVTVYIDSAILIPWYDCKVVSFCPEGENTLQVWLDVIGYVRERYNRHIHWLDTGEGHS